MASPALARSATFKVALIGPAGSGKTAWRTRLATGEFPKAGAVPAPATSTARMTLSDGTDVLFEIIEVGAGQPVQFVAAATVLMFDATDTGPDASMVQACTIMAQYRRAGTHLMGPLVMCANKCDLRGSAGSNALQVFVAQLTASQFPRPSAFLEVSAKNMYQLGDPLLFIARKLLGDMGLGYGMRPLEPPLVDPLPCATRAFKDAVAAAPQRLVDPPDTVLIKVALIGPAGGGKTAWRTRVCTGEFLGGRDSPEWCQETTMPLSGVSVRFRILEFPDGVDNIPSSMDAIVVLFDANDPEQFTDAAAMVSAYQALVTSGARKVRPLVVCASKCDLGGYRPERDHQQVLYARLMTKLYPAGRPAYYEVSAKNMYQLTCPLLFLARDVLGVQALTYACPPLEPPLASGCEPVEPVEPERVIEFAEPEPVQFRLVKAPALAEPGGADIPPASGKAATAAIANRRARADAVRHTTLGACGYNISVKGAYMDGTIPLDNLVLRLRVGEARERWDRYINAERNCEIAETREAAAHAEAARACAAAVSSVDTARNYSDITDVQATVALDALAAAAKAVASAL